MSEPFLGEVRMFGFNFAPRGWALCDGQLLPINQNQALYSLLGTMFGGDGRTTFALPDMRSRTPIHVSSQYREGSKGGVETVALASAQIPAHRHTVRASLSVGDNAVPTDKVLAGASAGPVYGMTANAAMLPTTLTNAGGSQAHNNMQPYQVVNFCIATAGLFPSRN